MASVTLRGFDELERRLGNIDADQPLREGFTRAAIIVEGDAKRNVHRITGKLQGSLGHVIEGRGFDLRARVGPQPDTSPRRYSRSMTARWKRPRDGVNRGDPRRYARHEELGTRHRPGHPFLIPALTSNVERIRRVIAAALERALR